MKTIIHLIPYNIHFIINTSKIFFQYIPFYQLVCLSFILKSMITMFSYAKNKPLHIIYNYVMNISNIVRSKILTNVVRIILNRAHHVVYI